MSKQNQKQRGYKCGFSRKTAPDDCERSPQPQPEAALCGECGHEQSPTDPTRCVFHPAEPNPHGHRIYHCGCRCAFPVPVEAPAPDVPHSLSDCIARVANVEDLERKAYGSAPDKGEVALTVEAGEAPAVAETCKWSWNNRKDFRATGCGDGLALDGGKHHFDFDQAFRFCPYCGKELSHE